jgi:hypothetical protein
VTSAAEYRRKSDDLLREATRTENLNARSRLINQAIALNELALETEQAMSARHRAGATVIPFEDQA